MSNGYKVMGRPVAHPETLELLGENMPLTLAGSFARLIVSQSEQLSKPVWDCIEVREATGQLHNAYGVRRKDIPTYDVIGESNALGSVFIRTAMTDLSAAVQVAQDQANKYLRRSYDRVCVFNNLTGKREVDYPIKAEPLTVTNPISVRVPPELVASALTVSDLAEDLYRKMRDTMKLEEKPSVYYKVRAFYDWNKPVDVLGAWNTDLEAAKAYAEKVRDNITEGVRPNPHGWASIAVIEEPNGKEIAHYFIGDRSATKWNPAPIQIPVTFSNVSMTTIKRADLKRCNICASLVDSTGMGPHSEWHIDLGK